MGDRCKSLQYKDLRRRWYARFDITPYAAMVYVKSRRNRRATMFWHSICYKKIPKKTFVQYCRLKNLC